MNITDILSLWGWSKIGENILAAVKSAITDQASDAAEVGAKRLAQKAWEEVVWSRSLSKYREHLLKAVETTRVLGNPKPISITEIYTDVKVYDKAGAFRRSELVQSSFSHLQQHEDAFPKTSGLNAVLTGKNLYVLGRPGAGKTTFLKHIAMLGCTGAFAKTPMYLALRECSLTAESDLLTLLADQFSGCGIPDTKAFLDDLLRSEKAAVLLDGLDEVPELNGVRAHLINEVIRIARSYPETQICLSCRVAATEYTFENFVYIEVADFSEAQGLEFISRWFAYDVTRRQNFLSQWSAPDAKVLRELARTPLLLTMICLAFEDNLSVPVRRVDIFRDAIDTLIRRWDVTRNISRNPPLLGVKRHRYEHLFCTLAANTFQYDRLIFDEKYAVDLIIDWVGQLPSPEGRVVNSVEALGFLRSVEADTGLVVNRAKEKCSFSHLAIQEYFVAQSWLASHDLTVARDKARALLTSSKWREVFLFAAELAGDGSQLVDSMSVQCGMLLAMNPRFSLIHREARKIISSQINKRESLDGIEGEFRLQVEKEQRSAQIAEFTDSTPLRLESIQATLSQMARMLTLPVYAADRNLIVLLHRAFATDWQYFGGLLATKAIDARLSAQVEPNYATLLNAIQLTIECALRAACKDRVGAIRRALSGA